MGRGRDNIFVFVKPWSLHHKEGIFQRLNSIGTVQAQNYIEADPVCIAEHYAFLKERVPHYQKIFDDFLGKHIHLAWYIGKQEEFDSEKEFIREHFGKDIEPYAFHRRNAIHVSDSQESFAREFAIWKGYLQ